MAAWLIPYYLPSFGRGQQKLACPASGKVTAWQTGAVYELQTLGLCGQGGCQRAAAAVGLVMQHALRIENVLKHESSF